VAAFPEGLHRVCAERPERIQARDAGSLRAAAGFGMQHFGVGAEFAHVAEHQPGLVSARGERVDGGIERPGIRVVAIVDDSYNANPGSLHAAIDLLASSGDEGWLVLGDMRELGDDAELLHAEAGRRAKAAGIARLYALGALSARAADGFGDGARVFGSHDALAQALMQDLHERARATPSVRVLVKGSRGSAMDRVVKALLPQGGTTDAA